MEEMNNNELERLSTAIVKAIVKSEEVQKVLTDIQKEDEVCTEGLLVLMVKMHALADAAEELRDISKEMKGQNSRAENFYIEGKRLSPQEVAFEEFCRKNFDEEKWLKDLKLTF